MLEPAIAKELHAIRDRLLSAEELLPEEQLARYYGTFAARFGPDALRAMPDDELAETIHNHTNKQSLVYWLEFKNDAEMPARFGSIAGGSALKFGIYRRKETGLWMTGSPMDQREMTVAEANAIAKRNRDQLVAAADVLAAFRASHGSDYLALQRDIMTVAPDVSDLAWGHKYLSLLYPDVLDDYHATSYQRFHLIRLLQQPPKDGGRYTAAGTFLELARELKMPINHLTTCTNERHGRPCRYWRIGTGTAEKPKSEWPSMEEGGFMSMGWPDLGDLSATEPTEAGRNAVRASLDEHYPNTPQTNGRKASEVFWFVRKMEVGDVVISADGSRVLAVGTITGNYYHVPNTVFPHRRNVAWKSIRTWQLPFAKEGLQTTVAELKNADNLIAIERERTFPPSSSAPLPVVTPPPAATLPLIVTRIQSALDRKGQVILYGPPGTGKTHWAERAAAELVARTWFGKPHAALTAEQRSEARGAVTQCTFHPAFGYEEFIEGFRPTERDGHLVFERRPGLFKRVCAAASEQASRPFFVLIDEINRGDVARIFGELLTALEKTRRGKPITLASGDIFAVPENVRIIATMNTADRSIALLDAALRRRFAFVELMPDASPLASAAPGGIPLGLWFDALNARLIKALKRDARNLQIGHSYFMHDGQPISELQRLIDVVRDDVIPLLEEYCYEDYDALASILGPTIVQRERRRIDDGLFRPGREQDLVRALLETSPEIIATAHATNAPAESAEPEHADD